MKEKLHKRRIDLLLGIAAVVILILAVLVIGRPRDEEVPEQQAAEPSAPTTQTDTQPQPEATEAPVSAEESGFRYGELLFDSSYVHTIDILINDWDTFVETAPEEEYSDCSLIIDGERFDHVAIRAKGNSSQKVATKAANGRYSLKIEFDHYVDGQTYYGLDKLHLNNLAFDSTCVKDYIAYYLMAEMDVPASYCSYVFVTVNGADHGLYIALEGIEDSFLERYFGEDYGNFLKPDDKHNQVVTETAKTDETAETGKTTAPETEKTAAAEESTKSAAAEKTPTDAASTEAKTSGSQNSWLKEGQVELATLTYVDDQIDSYAVLFNSAKSDFSDKDKEKLIRSIKKLNEMKDLDEVIAVDEVINYMTVQNFLVNYDGYTGTRVHNYYLYVGKDGVMQMLPWDYNLSFGAYGKGMTASQVVNCPIDTPYGDEIGSRPMFDWIVRSYAYKEQYYDRTLYLVENYIENGTLESEIDRIYGLIRAYVQRDPTAWVTVEEFDAGIGELKQIIALRGESMKLQAEGKIPATAAGQAADPDSLLSVGELELSKSKIGFGK